MPRTTVRGYYFARMDILLNTIGSHGDVHPFVGLGIRLLRRGHRVRLVTNEHFGPLVRAAGIEFIELGKSDEYLKLALDPKMWKSHTAFKVVFSAIARLMDDHVRIIQQHLSDETVLVASSLCLGARIAEDKFGFPMATVHLSPAVLRTVYEVPKLPMLFMPGWMPKAIKRRIWEGGDRWMIDPVIAGPINQLRSKYGLPPVAAILRDWWHSPRMVIGMFPAWFAAPQPDWPTQLRLTSFPLYDERGISALPENLEAFLDSGDPPVAFTPGSAMFDGAHFFSVAADVCRRLGVRGLLLSRHREHLPPDLPAGVIHVDYAPFSQLLPRVAALVHHGGIGTTAQGLAAGARQLVVPMSHDQFDNAHRARMLGVAEVVKSSRLSPWRAARALKRLLDSRDVAADCRSVAQRFYGVDGLEMSCDLVESLAETTTAAPGKVPAHSLPSR